LQANNVGLSVNGSAPTADTSCAIPLGLTTMRLGSSETATGNASHTRYIRKITYYPTALPDATLQQLSAL